MRFRALLGTALAVVLAIPLALARPAAAGATQVSGLTVATSNSAAGGTATYTLAFTASAAGALAGGSGAAITLTFSPGPTVTDAIYLVTAGGVSVPVTGVASTQNSSTTFTLDLAPSASIGASTAVQVRVENVTNPQTTGAETLGISTTADTVPVSGTVDITAATSVQDLTVSLSTHLVGATANYTVGFTLQHDLDGGQAITVQAPPGTDLAKAAPYVLQFQQTGRFYYPTWDEGDVVTSAGPGSGTDNVAVIPIRSTDSYAAGSALTLTIYGLINPSAANADLTLQLTTTTDPAPATTAPYGIVGVTVQTAGLTGGSVGEPYSGAITASGGTPPYSFSWSGGTPPGLALAGSGAVSGVPTAAGTYTFTLTGTDGSSPPEQSTAMAVIGVSPAGVPACAPGVSSGGLYGAVYDTATGRAISGAVVSAIQPYNVYLDGVNPTVTTGGSGCYTLSDATGSFQVSASAAGYAIANTPATVGSTWVQVNLALTAQTGTCPAPGAGTYVYGMVSDAEGRGLANASLDFGSNVTAVTDASGCYQADVGALVVGPNGPTLQGTASLTGYGSSTLLVQGKSSVATLLNFLLAASGPSLAVTPASVQVDAGATAQLTANWSPGSGAPAQAVAATWQSADNSVATVSAAGRVTGAAGGQSTVVTATYEGVSGQATVQVVAPALTGITVSPSAVKLAVGQQQALTVSGQFANGATGPVTSPVIWTTSDAQVAAVSSSGAVMAVGVGRAVVTADVGGLQAQATISVTMGTPALATAVAGGGQYAVLGQPFATPLSVRVVDAAGDPLAGVTVAFAAPTSGSAPTATFPGGGATAAVPTDAGGVATAPPLRAAGTYGAFTVTATVAGLSSPVGFPLTDASSILQQCGPDELATDVSAGGLVILDCPDVIMVQQPMTIQAGQTVIVDGTIAPPGGGEILLSPSAQPSPAVCGTTVVTPPNTLQGGLFYVCSGGNLTITHVTLSGPFGSPALEGPSGDAGSGGQWGSNGSPASVRGATGGNGQSGNPGGNGQPGTAVQGGLLYVAQGAAASISDSTLQAAIAQGGASGVGGNGGSGGGAGAGGSWCDLETVDFGPSTVDYYPVNCVYNGKSGGGAGGSAQGGGGGSTGAGGSAEGGAVYNAGTLTVTDTSFTLDEALGGQGGMGGGGGWGGGGGSGGLGAPGIPQHSSSCDAGTGGSGGTGAGGSKGASGARGGSAGAGLGGAVYNASTGVLTVTGGSFDHDKAVGGAAGGGGGGGWGGPGGWGGDGGQGGPATYPCQGGGGGQGANGASGGSGGSGGAVPPGGAGQGGAIYNAGKLTITGTAFGASHGDLAQGAAGAGGGAGGAGGAGGQGGVGGWGGVGTPVGAPGFTGAPGCNGSGGAGGNGGNGGNGQGGAIYTTDAVVLNNVTFTGTAQVDHNAAVGGAGGAPGTAGAGAPNTQSVSGCGSSGGASTGPKGVTAPPVPQKGADGTGSAPDVYDAGQGLQVVTQVLPGGVVDQPYSATLDAIGGTEPYAWMPLPGLPLPSWAHMDGFGDISGVPPAPGTYTFGVEVEDAATTPSAQATLSLTVVQPLSVTPSQLGGATVGQPYTETFTATGGTAPYTWTETGLLPLGLSFSSQGNTATISGTAAKGGPADFTLQLVDASDTPHTVTVPLVLVAAPPGIGVTGGSTATSTVPGGSASAGGAGSQTPDTTADAMGGAGTVNVANYTGNPGGTATFAGQGTSYFDVSVANGSTFTDLTITQCNLPSRFGGIWWYGPQGWVFASTQMVVNGCDVLYIDANSVPPISALTGSIFATGNPPPAPAVTGLIPAQGPMAGGAVVAIQGTNLSDATAVDFGSITASQFLVISPAQVDAVAPAGSGAVNVVVVTPSGSSTPTAADRFTYTNPARYVPPAVSGPTPPGPSVRPAGGTLATADGAFNMAVPAGAVSRGGIAWVGENTGVLPSLPPGLTQVGPVFTLTGSAFTTPQTAVLRYSGAALGGLAPDRLAVYARGADGTWRPAPTAVNASAGTVRVRISGPETLAVFAATGVFADVAAGYWASADIDALLAAGAVGGFPDGTFWPDQPVTRAQFVKMLDDVLGLAPAAGASTPYTDVPTAAWYAPYIAAAAQASIVRGTLPATFSPDAILTREQAAVLLARGLQLTQTAPLSFSDAQRIDSWAAADVRRAVAAGLIAGFPDGTFAPLGALTRAQASKLVALAWQRQAP